MARIIAILCSLLALGAYAQPTETRTLRIASPDTVSAIHVDNLLRTVYSTLQIRTEFIKLPNKRASFESNRGAIDGEAVRSNEVVLEYPNLIRVDVPLAHAVQVLAIKKQNKKQVSGLQDLPKLKQIAVVRGSTRMEALTQNWSNIITVSKYEQLFAMLQHDRVDAALAPMSILLTEIADAGMKPEQFTFIEVDREPMYHFLHQKHADLLPLIEAELRKIKGNKESIFAAK